MTTTEPDNEKLAPVEQLRDLAISMVAGLHRDHSDDRVAFAGEWTACGHAICRQVRRAVDGVETHPWPTCDDQACPGFGTEHAPIPPNPGLSLMERINRIGVDLSVILELNEAAMHRTFEQNAVSRDDATEVLHLFDWDSIVALRRARLVLSDAAELYDREKPAEPNEFEGMVATYRLSCGCTVESGPGGVRLSVGQSWPCPSRGELSRVTGVTFTLPAF